MKKVVKIFLPFIVLSSTILCGCKNKQKVDNRVLLTFGDVHATESREIDTQELHDLTSERKESFLFVVSTTTCGCWSDFEPNLNAYLKEKQALCYRIDYNDMQGKGATYGLANISSSTTTFAIFENGNLKTSLCTSSNKDIMYDKNTFFKYMDENVILPKCYFITKDDVSLIKASDKKAVIYYERSKCDDCSALNPGLLYSYVKEHGNMNRIYVLDCQPYWKSSSDPEYETVYVAIKKELGLAKETNPNFGYSSGVFPYFSLLDNGNYASGAVIFNDRVQQIDNKIIITDSFYDEETVERLQFTSTVLKGKELSFSDVNIGATRVTLKDEAKDRLYKDILYSFLDYALPQVTYEL